MNVTVLFGGPGDEREVSLVSGRAVIEGLKKAGHEVFASDVFPNDLRGLDHPCDVIFPVLHGQFGESGELQEILERRGIPFVGSNSAASRLGMNKIDTKVAWQKVGLPTPKWDEVTSTSLSPRIPCVVKPIASGSSVGVSICRSETDATEAIKGVIHGHGKALVEQLIEGPELTVGLLEEKPLDPIRIVPKSGFFDFHAKYKANDTEHRFDTGLPKSVVQHCCELARDANRVVGARDLARVDIMLDAENNPYLLEINTLPGFTPKSLLPEAASHAGIAFPALVDRLVRRAYARGGS